MSLPSAARFVVIGAGVHGLSTAWHLAKELRARRLGDGAQIVVLDKTGVGAGASGIACGVIRNNYFQPAMRELMAYSVGIWESDPDAFSYHPVGYLQISRDISREERLAAEQAFFARIGEIFASTFEISELGKAVTQAAVYRVLPAWRSRSRHQLISRLAVSKSPTRAERMLRKRRASTNSESVSKARVSQWIASRGRAGEASIPKPYWACASTRPDAALSLATSSKASCALSGSRSATAKA